MRQMKPTLPRTTKAWPNMMQEAYRLATVHIINLANMLVQRTRFMILMDTEATFTFRTSRRSRCGCRWQSWLCSPSLVVLLASGQLFERSLEQNILAAS